jgi:hypothetical protein
MKVRRAWGIFYSALGKNIPYSRTFLFALLFVLILVYVQVDYDSKCGNRIKFIKLRLGAARKSIQVFFENNGRYPDSFNEFRIWSKGGEWNKMIVDFTSDIQSDVPEYRQLNDKGGYYYDPNTGEIRLNLTRPVKEYLKWYKGRYRDQIPSSW